MLFFFIPLFPVKRGEPYLECSRCGYAGAAQFAEPPTPGGETSGGRDTRGKGEGEQEIREKRCPSCGSYIPAAYRFCPHCGQRLRM